MIGRDGLLEPRATSVRALIVCVCNGAWQFSTLKTLKATRNLIAEVTIERLPRLMHLDLSYNKLDGIPDLSGFKACALPLPPPVPLDLTARGRTLPPTADAHSVCLGASRLSRTSTCRIT